MSNNIIRKESPCETWKQNANKRPTQLIQTPQDKDDVTGRKVDGGAEQEWGGGEGGGRSRNSG